MGTTGYIHWGMMLAVGSNTPYFSHVGVLPDDNWYQVLSNVSTTNCIWNHLVGVKEGANMKIFVNGVLVNTSNSNPAGLRDAVWIGGNVYDGNSWVDGKIDELAIWNRALTIQEVTNLYYPAQSNQIVSQPTIATINTGENAQFLVDTENESFFQWQSNPLDLGWQNVTNNSTYSGSTTNTLTVANTSISNHNQSFRAIVSNGDCTDTTDVVQIVISDTCIANITVYDTLFTTVMDTLIINTSLSLPAPNNENTILIYPNPASDHITIDNGNFGAMVGYSIKITNNAGQQVFQSAINQAQFFLDLNTWTGNGLYFVNILDPQNNIVIVRKIVLQ
jgi:hypothetical protein